MNKEQLLAWAVKNVTVWPHLTIMLPRGVLWRNDEVLGMCLVAWLPTPADSPEEVISVTRGEWEAARVACGMPQSAPVQQSELTADEILTWVARNVHKWEDAQQIVGNQREFFYNSASFWDDRICFTGCAAHTITRDQWLSRRATDELARNIHSWQGSAGDVLTKCGARAIWVAPDSCRSESLTRDQWLARRAELQNKPSWDEAPSWAEWLAQHACGLWGWGHGEADKTSISGSDLWCAIGMGVLVTSGQKGEVLGDWRDTLERRPADLSEEAVTERLTEATQVVLAAVPELMGEKYMIDPGVTAHSILESAGGHMRDRAVTYDKPEGERSMGATVEAFRAITGHKLTEEQGWLFMQLLKAVRSQQGAYRADSYEDGAAYVSLAGEAAARERGGAQ